MKKIVLLLLVAVMCLSLVACGRKATTPGIAEIKDCKIEITDFKNGGDYAIVYVDFTNNSDKSISLSYHAKIKMFQNGVELKTAIFHSEDEGIEFDEDDAVQPGYTISMAFRCELKNNSPVVVQICDTSNNIISEKSFDK